MARTPLSPMQIDKNYKKTWKEATGDSENMRKDLIKSGVGPASVLTPEQFFDLLSAFCNTIVIALLNSLEEKISGALSCDSNREVLFCVEDTIIPNIFFLTRGKAYLNTKAHSHINDYSLLDSMLYFIAFYLTRGKYWKVLEQNGLNVVWGDKPDTIIICRRPEEE